MEFFFSNRSVHYGEWSRKVSLAAYLEQHPSWVELVHTIACCHGTCLCGTIQLCTNLNVQLLFVKVLNYKVQWRVVSAVLKSPLRSFGMEIMKLQTYLTQTTVYKIMNSKKNWLGHSFKLTWYLMLTCHPNI